MLNRGSGSIREAYPCSPSGFKMLLQAPQTGTAEPRAILRQVHLLMTTLRLLFGITEEQEHTKRLL